MLLLTAAALALAADGPISKFRDHKVEVDRVLARPIGEVERCLIDLDGPGLASVYRQPDRPDAVTLIWTTKGPFSQFATWRVDLARADAGTRILAWMPEKMMRSCL